MNKFIELTKTVLGDVELDIKFFPTNENITIVNKDTDNNLLIKKKVKKIFKSLGHEVKLEEFSIPKRIYNGDELLSIKTWILNFKKTNNIPEKIKISIKLLNNLSANPESGEWLDSVLFENEIYKVSIGTEAPEAMLSRAMENYFMPKRFVKLLKSENDNFADKTFFDYLENGFEINFPELINEEEVKIHFIIAENYNKGNEDISTWLAVGMTIKELEKLLK